MKTYTGPVTGYDDEYTTAARYATWPHLTPCEQPLRPHRVVMRHVIGQARFAASVRVLDQAAVYLEACAKKMVAAMVVCQAAITAQRRIQCRMWKPRWGGVTHER